MAEPPCDPGRPFLELRLPGVSIECLLVPAGRFPMGSANEQYSEAPIHAVAISRPFYLGRLPVTQRQWASLRSGNPSAFPLSPDHPVDSVSWLDAVRFCELASAHTGRSVRLPSEAEWEYASRAASQSEFFFSQEGPFADEASIPARLRRKLRDYAWFDENSRDTTHAVGLRRPNAWGLGDMIGNVWEWCADYWHNHYDGAPGDGRPWLEPRPTRPLRCLRGGAWDMNAFRCRSCYRSWDAEDLRTNRFGFRVCVDSAQR